MAWCNSKITNKTSRHPIVEKIIIHGLKRTKPIVVLRELLIKKGQAFSTSDLLESIQQLKNLQIFSYVRPYLSLKENNKVVVTIDVKEKWTTIPYFSYTAGGGLRYMRAGLYDINWLGKYIQIGAEYTNWNGESGGAFWYDNPRVFNKKNRITMTVESTQKPRTMYTTQGNIQARFVLKRSAFSLSYKKTFHNIFQIGWLAEYFEDNIHDLNDISLSNSSKALITKNSSSTTLLNTLTLKLGRLNYDIDVINGKESQLLLSHSSKQLLSNTSFNKVKWLNQAYFQLPWRRSYIATNFVLASTNTELIQQYYSVGGFDNIRGYFDGQFRNKSFWQANIEYRIPSYRSPWIVLQHIFFIDVANATDRIEKLGKFSNNIYSAGIGFRLISPKIYSFNGRLDFALYTSGSSKTSISLGTQHFF